MALLVDALDALFRGHIEQDVRDPPFSFGPSLAGDSTNAPSAQLLRTQNDWRGDATKLAEQTNKLTDITLATRNAL
ncbi:hypothetical protein [Nonomuraea sp. NPDC049400]|uniref:hypothetical protein n=1 Tax=Nonomuraea sp. NPDC049400 TaxID=3364352 RepID=UPI0037A6B8D8